MALIPEVKCPRCDRRYMALRTRCPYCGTSRRRRTGKSAETDNSMWKTVVGAALMLTLAIGVVVLISDASKARTAANEASLQAQRESQTDNLERNVTSLAQEADDYLAEQAAIAAENGEDVPEEQTTVVPVVPEIPVESIKLFNADTDRELSTAKSTNFDYDISVPIGVSYNLGFKVVPESRQEDAVATWSSSDTKVCTVLQSGKITAMSKGTAYFYCTVENAQCVLIVRVN